MLGDPRMLRPAPPHVARILYAPVEIAQCCSEDLPNLVARLHGRGSSLCECSQCGRVVAGEESASMSITTICDGVLEMYCSKGGVAQNLTPEGSTTV